MAVGTGGARGGPGPPPPTFQRCKKNSMGEKALEWRKWGVKLEKFPGSLRSPSFIMKQQFKINIILLKCLTKPIYGSKPNHK